MASIRLIGATHATHDEGTLLKVTRNEALAAANASVVTLRRAAELVRAGQAEWVGEKGDEVVIVDAVALNAQGHALADALRQADLGSSRYDALYVAVHTLASIAAPGDHEAPLALIDRLYPLKREAEPTPDAAPVGGSKQDPAVSPAANADTTAG